MIVLMPRLDLRFFSIRFFAHFNRLILSSYLPVLPVPTSTRLTPWKFKPDMSKGSSDKAPLFLSFSILGTKFTTHVWSRNRPRDMIKCRVHWPSRKKIVLPKIWPSTLSASPQVQDEQCSDQNPGRILLQVRIRTWLEKSIQLHERHEGKAPIRWKLGY